MGADRTAAQDYTTNAGRLMRKRLLASLIVCVALATQLGASLWGAAAARDGYVGCHRSPAFSVSLDEASPASRTESPVPASQTHDHASCSLCQLGFSVIDPVAPVLQAEPVVFHTRVARVETDTPPTRVVFNRSAPARAPPSLI